MTRSLVVLGPKRRGRPTRLECRASKRIDFMVTPTEHAALQQVARENNQPVAAVIRDAVNEYVSDYRER